MKTVSDDDISSINSEVFNIISSPNLGYVNANSAQKVSFSGECNNSGAQINILEIPLAESVICNDGQWRGEVSFIGLPDGEGELTFVYTYKDTSEKVIWFYIKDTTAPVVTWTNPTDGQTIGGDLTTYTITGTCTDNSSQVNISGVKTAIANCSNNIWTTNIDFSSLSDGAFVINAQQTDLAGNIGLISSINLIKSSVGPLATISNAPTNPSMSTSLSISIGGAQVVKYKYKVGPIGSIDCNQLTGYGAEFLISNPITDVLTTDQELKLCVLGIDTLGNTQDLNLATTHTWLKDTVSPTAVLSGAPGDPSSSTSLNVTVAGADVVSYEFKVGLLASTNCSLSAGYSAVTNVSTLITSGTAADGNYRLCVVGLDQAGNKQSYTSATVHEWEKDASVPTAILSGAPTNPSSSTSLNVTVSGTGITHYRYAVGAGLSCAAATYSSEISVANPITDVLPGDNSITLCVIGKNVVGTFQNTNSATSYTWTKDSQAPTGGSISILSGASHTNDLNTTLSLSATGASEMYITNTSGCSSGGSWLAYSTSSAWTLSSANSTNTVYIKFRDTALNESGCVNDTIVHDQVNPSAPTIASPTNSSNFNSSNVGSINLSGACETGSTVSWSGAISGSLTCSGAAYSTTLDLSGNADGSMSINVLQTDLAGNPSTATTVNITKDTVIPSLSGSVTDGVYSLSTVASPTLSWSAATDATSGIQKYQLALGTTSGASDVVNWTDIGTSESYSHSGLSLSAGINYYPSIRAVDNAGNISDVIQGNGWTVTTLLVLSPSTVSLLSGEALTFSASGGVTSYVYSDDGSGYLNTSTRVYTVPIDVTPTTEDVSVTDQVGQTSTVNVKIRAFETKDTSNFLADGVNTYPSSLITHGDNIYTAGGGDFSGDYRWYVRKSSDKGVNWTNSDPFQLYTSDPDMSSTDGKASSTAYGISVNSVGHVFVVGLANHNYISKWIVRSSNDQGVTWTTVDEYNLEVGYSASARTVHVALNGDIYVGGTANSSTGDFWVVRKSTDNGATWSTVDSHQPLSGAYENTVLSITSDPSGNVYAAGVVQAGTQKYHYIRKSTDAGSSWTVIDAYFLDANMDARAAAISIDSDGHIYVLTNVQNASSRKIMIVRKSINSGVSFYNSAQFDVDGIHFEGTSITFDSTQKLILSGNLEVIAGGARAMYVSRSVDSGTTWVNVDYGFGAGLGIHVKQVVPCFTGGQLCSLGSIFITGYNLRSFVRILSE